MKRLVAALIPVFAFAGIACAGCKNPEGNRRDSYSAESFLEYQAKVRTYLNTPGKRPAILTLRSVESSGAGNELPPDINYAVRSAMVFSEGLGAFRTGAKFGFIDLSGTIVIQPRFDYVDCFSDGLAAVQVKGKWGFIDRTGKLVIPANFDFAFGFSEDLALVKVGKLWGYIDKSGKFAIKPKFGAARSFSEGLASVGYYDKDHVWTTHQRTNGKWVWEFIDKNGKRELPLYDGIYSDFTGGMALVSRNIGYSEKYNDVIAQDYFIDKKGTKLWVLESSYITHLSDDMIVIQADEVKSEYPRYSFLDHNGKRPSGKTFEDLSSFSEGLSAVCEKGRCGFVDKKGEYAIDPVFSSAESFSEGLAAVRGAAEGDIGFVDKSGRWVITPKFGWAGYFNEGKAAVAIDGKFAYIDKTGKYIWKQPK
jgi:hypothetical protein